MAKTVSKKKASAVDYLSVRIEPSVAKDLITVLAKFSNLQMDHLLYGDKKKADRMLALNLFRVSVEEEMRKADK